MNSIASKISAVNKCSVKNDACNIDDELTEPRLHTNYLLCSKMQQMTQSGPNVWNRNHTNSTKNNLKTFAIIISVTRQLDW